MQTDKVFVTHLLSSPPLCKCDRLESTIIKLTDFYKESFAFNLLSHLDFLLLSQPPQMACPFQHCSCLVLSFLSEQADYPHLAAIPKKTIGEHLSKDISTQYRMAIYRQIGTDYTNLARIVRLHGLLKRRKTDMVLQFHFMSSKDVEHRGLLPKSDHVC